MNGTASNSNSGQDAKGKPGDGFDWGEVVFSYTRADFIADGGLIEVPAAVAGQYFRCPVGITESIWLACVADANSIVQSDRLRALLAACLAVAKANASNTDRACFTFRCVSPGPQREHPQFHHATHDLILHIGPGDDPSPVMTVMRPSEA